MKAAVVAAASAVLLPLAAAGEALAVPSQRAQLQLVETAPLTIRGTGFRPGELVRVVYAADRTSTVRTRAGATGTFTARFRAVEFDICQRPRIFAIGSLGTRAILRPPPPVCPAP